MPTNRIESLQQQMAVEQQQDEMAQTDRQTPYRYIDIAVYMPTNRIESLQLQLVVEQLEETVVGVQL